MINLTLQDLTSVVKNTKDFESINKSIKLSKTKSSLVLLVSDVVALLISFFGSLIAKYVIFDQALIFNDIINSYALLVPIVITMYVFSLSIQNLYPGFNIDKIEELRKLTYTSFTVYGIVGVSSFLMNTSIVSSRLSFLVSLTLSIFLVPLLRGMSRKIFAKNDWWGLPVIIIGSENTSQDLVQKFNNNPEIGFKPIIVMDDDTENWGYIEQVPVVGGADLLPQIKEKIQIEDAVLAISNNSLDQTNALIKKYSKYFNNITIVTNTTDNVSFWLKNKDFGGLLGVEFKFNLMTKSAQIIKRIFDIVATSALIIMLAPLFLLIALIIKLDSKGKILFTQLRVGVNHKLFKIYKFRSMQENAESLLQELLDNNPHLKEEYQKVLKLKEDPRSTRVGKYLRKFSLDELPQFFNVLKGEMSLIGPRATVPQEVAAYEGYEHIVFNVKPGISGLWQVSLTNPTMEERIVSNLYYIRNWSLFLDMYIFFKTILVVVSGRNN